MKKSLILFIAISMVLVGNNIFAQNQKYKVISLRSYFEKYLNLNLVKDGEIHSTFDTPVEANTQYRVNEIGDGKVALKGSNEKYLSIRGGKIVAASITIGDNEKFKIVKINEDWIALQCTDGSYWSIDPKKENLIITGPKSIREWETFNITVIFDPAKQVSNVIISGKITDSKTNKPIEAEIEVLNMNSGAIVETITSNASTGLYKTTKVTSSMKIALSVKKDNYLPASTNIETVITKPAITQNFVLSGIAIGERIVLNNILFQSGKSTLKAESFNELDKLYNFMKGSSTMKVEISGYTDNVGDDAANTNLSKARAQAVCNYLVSKGISTGKLVSMGYGKNNPIAPNNTEDGRQKNRRVEFKILEN